MKASESAVSVNYGVSAQKSPTYQDVPKCEVLSKRLEKLQVSFSRYMERMRYDGKRVGSEGRMPAARLVRDYSGMSGQRADEFGVCRAEGNFREDVLLAAESTCSCN